jgi:transposase
VGQDRPVVDRIVHDEVPVPRLVARLGNPGRLRACYEAGPTGYGLHRLLTSMGVGCEVVAPALIPRRAGDRVKTGKRDAARLARLLRAGELTPIRVPSPAEEAVRDLCRARADLFDDRRRTRQRLKAFLLRHGRIWRDGSSWARAHWRWLAAQSFGHPALDVTYAQYRAVLAARDAELAAVEAELMPWCAREPLTAAMCQLASYRGVADLSALTLGTEVVDWRRFASAEAFMGFTGLVPSEYSSGGSHPPWAHHQGRQPGGAHRPGGGRARLPAPSRDRRHPRPPPNPRQRGYPGPVLGRPAAPVRPLPADERPAQAHRRRHHRHRPRARRLHLGRDDCMTPPLRGHTRRLA